MINILFIHQSSELYGSDQTLLLLLKHLDKSRFKAVVVLPESGPLKDELEKSGITVTIAPVIKLYRKMFTPANLLKFMQDKKTGMSFIDGLNDEYNFDLIYSNTLAVLLGMFYARKKRIKHIWHVHEIITHPKPVAALFPKLLKHYADVVVCNSSATKNNLTGREKSLLQKTEIIYNGIESMPVTAAIQDKKEFGFNASDIVITIVGRISRLKGHAWLLSTYINYFKDDPHVKLLIVGSPVPGQEYYLDAVKLLITNNDLNGRVKLLPFQKDLQSIWHITDIAIMPSTEAESFGLAAAEAMLAKKPVIASNLGGLKEIVVNNETGLLVEPNNEEALQTALKQLINNSTLREKFGKKGQERISNKFSVEKYVSGFTQLFTLAVNK